MEPNTIKRHTAINILMLTVNLFILAACSNGETADEGTEKESILVKTERVSSAPVSEEVVFSGNIEGATTVKLGFMVPGKVAEIANKVGQFVSKGQLIAALETTNYTLNKRLADVQLLETEQEYGRLKLLHSRGSVSENDFSKISSSLERAQLQQQLELKNLRDTRLLAPIDGILLTKQVEVGEIIAAGSPLFVIADIKKVSVLAFVPQGELKELQVGQKASVKIASLDGVFVGQIKELGAVADEASRTFTIKIEIDNQGLELRPGMIAETKIPLAKQKSAIRLPTECIINDLGNQSYVYVLDKDGKKAFKRRVSLGKITENSIEIKAGLSAGETVVVAGQTKLYDGAAIVAQN